MMAPDFLQQHILLQSDRLNTYGDVRDEVTNYIIHKAAQVGDNASDGGGPAPMDVGAVDRKGYGKKGDGWKGKGKWDKGWGKYGKGGYNQTQSRGAKGSWYGSGKDGGKQKTKGKDKGKSPGKGPKQPFNGYCSNPNCELWGHKFADCRKYGGGAYKPRQPRHDKDGGVRMRDASAIDKGAQNGGNVSAQSTKANDVGPIEKSKTSQPKKNWVLAIERDGPVERFDVAQTSRCGLADPSEVVDVVLGVLPTAANLLEQSSHVRRDCVREDVRSQEETDSNEKLVCTVEDEYIDVAFDSGSAVTTCPDEFAKEFPTESAPSEVLRTATGHVIQNSGRRTVNLEHEEGAPVTATFIPSSVNKVIVSAARRTNVGLERYLMMMRVPT